VNCKKIKGLFISIFAVPWCIIILLVSILLTIYNHNTHLISTTSFNVSTRPSSYVHVNI